LNLNRKISNQKDNESVINYEYGIWYTGWSTRRAAPDHAEGSPDITSELLLSFFIILNFPGNEAPRYRAAEY
jgi:hypothetical protein